ncbi:MAG: aldehyde dehydrogenase family protein [Methanobacteriota archaeon]
MTCGEAGEGNCGGIILNPADRREVVGFAPPSDKPGVAGAVDCAAEGFRAWSGVSMIGRRKALLAIANALEENAKSLARLLTMEVGKPLAEANAEVAGAAATLRYYAGLKIRERVETRGEGLAQTFYEREPYGVCAIVLPWNYPLSLLIWKAAPALLAGNSIVIKPSEHAPLTVATAANLAARSLPAGALEVVCGGDDVGGWLVSDRGVARVAVTGSPETGPRVLALAANRPAKVTLELGGNDPLIVMDDVNLDMRFEPIFWTSLRNCGQVCVAAKRVYVHRKLYKKFVHRYVTRVKALRIGNGLEPNIELGPVNNEAQLRKVQSLVNKSVRSGGKLEVGGRRLSGPLKYGLFYEPAVVTGLDNGSGLVKEEQFGPAVPIIPFESVGEAVDMANDCGLALGATVWSGDRPRALKIARELDAGVVWVNSPLAVDISAPFGGFKGSGFGRELGEQGYCEYAATKSYVLR